MSKPAASPFPTRAERSQEREDKREAVLLAAVRMFNARGFHATSLDDVAASLRVSKPTIYYYLGNKEEVLLECLTRGMELLRAAAAEAHARVGSGLERLRGFLLSYAQVNMDEFGRCVIRTSEDMLSAAGAQRFRAMKREVDGALRALVAAGIADGSVAPVDVKLAAFTLAGALNWPARWYDPEGSRTAREIAETMVTILLDGIAPASGRAVGGRDTKEMDDGDRTR